MSSGGYGALNLGLRHQGTYSVILSMMPYGEPGAVTRSLLGGSRKLWLANELAKPLHPHHGLRSLNGGLPGRRPP